MTLERIIELKVSFTVTGYTETHPCPPGDLNTLAAVMKRAASVSIIEHLEFVFGTAIRDAEVRCTVSMKPDRIIGL